MELRPLIEEPINNLWEKYRANDFTSIPPLSVASLPNAEIIFIGINPSLSEEDRIRLLKEGNRKLETYEMSNNEPDHKYFKKFSDIATKTDMKWEHFDLLYIRETKQEKIKDLLKSPEGLDFIYSQLMVTKKIIDSLLKNKSTKILVVNNTLARTFMGKDKSTEKKENIWLDYNFEWQEHLGTYTIENTPIFFTSMLTGQRALDIGSYERLIWHINFVKRRG